MGIAYYRGYVAHLAGCHEEQKGAMMAVGMSFDDALAFCSQARFQHHLQIAACNAPSNVTMSGDLGSIVKAKEILDEDGVFARQLQVHVAYHSHHMARCAKAYKNCLTLMNIRPQSPRNDCIWYSSVHENVDLLQEPLDHLSGGYWVDNMAKPVLFS